MPADDFARGAMKKRRYDNPHFYYPGKIAILGM